MENISKLLVGTALLWFAVAAAADTPYPSVSYDCSQKEDKLIIAAAMVYVDNYPSLYVRSTEEQICKLSSGEYRVVMEYSVIQKCGIMSVAISIYRGSANLKRQEVGVGLCYGVLNTLEEEKVRISIDGKSGKLVSKWGEE